MWIVVAERCLRDQCGGGDADIDAIDVGDDVAEERKRNEPAGDAGEGDGWNRHNEWGLGYIPALSLMVQMRKEGVRETPHRGSGAALYRLTGGALIGIGLLLGSLVGIFPNVISFNGSPHETWDLLLKTAILTVGRFVLGVAIGTRGVRLYNRGRRLALPVMPVNDAFDGATPAPILYLRSFAADAPAAKAPIALTGVYIPTVTTHEERLVRVLKSIGPVIAIGRPEDLVPELGATRLYVPNGEWQPQVRQRLLQSQLVLLRCATTPGLVWEVQTVIAEKLPTQVILLIPAGSGYAKFVEQYGTLFPRGLPEWDGSTKARGLDIQGLVSFDAEWTPRLTRVVAKMPFFEEAALRRAFQQVLDAANVGARLKGRSFSERIGAPFEIASATVAGLLMLSITVPLVMPFEKRARAVRFFSKSNLTVLAEKSPGLADAIRERPPSQELNQWAESPSNLHELALQIPRRALSGIQRASDALLVETMGLNLEMFHAMSDTDCAIASGAVSVAAESRVRAEVIERTFVTADYQRRRWLNNLALLELGLEEGPIRLVSTPELTDALKLQGEALARADRADLCHVRAALAAIASLPAHTRAVLFWADLQGQGQLSTGP